MDEAFINHCIGLIILMSVNIALGSLGSIFVNRFDGWRFFKGILKGAIIALCFVATYYAGYMNPDLIVININGIDANIVTALDLIILAGYFHYAKQVIEKLVALLGKDFGEEMKNKIRKKPPED